MKLKWAYLIILSTILAMSYVGFGITSGIDVGIIGGTYGYHTNVTVTGTYTGSGAMTNTVSSTAAGGLTGITSSPTQTTTALTGTLIGVHGSSRVNAINGTGTVIGGKFQSGNYGTGTNITLVQGVYAEVVNKVPAANVTWTYARAFEANMDLNQGSASKTNTITNAAMYHGIYNLPTAGAYATVTNGYGIKLRNQAIGGTGQMLDAGFYLDDLSHTGGIYGWDFGVDFSGMASGGFGTADFRGVNGETISNNTDGKWDFGAANIGTTGEIVGKFKEIAKPADTVVLSAAECSDTIITNAGWDGADVQTFTLPDADTSVGAGLRFIYLPAVTDGDTDTFFDCEGTTTQFYIDGAAVGNGERLQLDNGTIGESLECYTATLDGTTYDWFCINRGVASAWADAGS